MRILFSAPHILIDDFTGDAIRIRELISNLSRNNTVIALVQAQNSRLNLDIGTAEIEILPALRLHRQISSLIVSPFHLLKLYRKHRPDIIYEVLGGIFGLGWLAKILNIPIVSEIQGPIRTEERLMGINPFYADLIHPVLTRISTSLSERIVVVGLGLKTSLAQSDNITLNKIRVIPNGANVQVFRSMDQSAKRRELGLNENCYYVGFVGNVAPWQGLECLTAAAPYVLNEIPETRFLIVGDGVLKQKLIQIVNRMGLSTKFIFTGKVRYEEIPKYINSFDLCVAPFTGSKVWLSPLKIYEYLACEKPVITSDIPGIDFVERVNAGRCIPPENSNMLAQMIVEVLGDAELRRLMGRNGRIEILTKYTWSHAANKVEELCNEVLQKHL